MRDPKAFVDILEDIDNFKTKQKVQAHSTFEVIISRDINNILYISSTKYVEKLMMNYERMFGQQP
jgi:hypothetical protein